MKINIYYHIAQLGDWKRVSTEQVESLMCSGLYDVADRIYVSMLGSEKIVLPDKYMMLYTNTDINLAELPILNILHKQSKYEDFRILYIHTKGVSWQEQNKNHDAMTAWRKYMEYFMINQWPECIS